MKKFLFMLLILIIATPVFSEEVFRIEPIEKVRELVQFPELTNEEKRIIAEQAQLLLKDIYVNRFAKLDYYPEHPDPVPAVAEVIKNIETLSTDEMELKLFEIFAAQRDLHLNYIFPEPYGNFTTVIPLLFSRTEGKGNFFEVRVGDLNEEFIETFAPEQRIPEVGDEVIKFNEMPIIEAIQDQMKTSQGANVYGGFKRALQKLTMKPQRLIPLPLTDSVTITLKSHNLGDEYTITLPWLVYWFEEEPTVPGGSRAESYMIKPISSKTKKRTPFDILCRSPCTAVLSL